MFLYFCWSKPVITLITYLKSGKYLSTDYFVSLLLLLLFLLFYYSYSDPILLCLSTDYNQHHKYLIVLYGSSYSVTMQLIELSWCYHKCSVHHRMFTIKCSPQDVHHKMFTIRCSPKDVHHRCSVKSKVGNEVNSQVSKYHAHITSKETIGR